MLRQFSVLLACCLTTVLCHGFGSPGLIVQQNTQYGCKPVTHYTTHIQTVVQEQPILKTVQVREPQYNTQYQQTYVTVTTGTVAYVTTTQLSTQFNTRTRTVTQRVTETNTRYVYIPTVVTADVTVAQTLPVVGETSVVYETVYATHYVTTTQTIVSTQLRDSLVFVPTYETAFDFVASPVTTTVIEQIPLASTQTVMVQGFGNTLYITRNVPVIETQTIQQKVPIYRTTRIQALEYQTVTIQNTATVTVGCEGQYLGGPQPGQPGGVPLGAIGGNIPFGPSGQQRIGQPIGPEPGQPGGVPLGAIGGDIPFGPSGQQRIGQPIGPEQGQPGDVQQPLGDGVSLGALLQPGILQVANSL